MRRRLLALAPAALVAVAIVPWALGWARLPDPVATHWAFDGTPDGSTPRVVAVLLAVVPAVFGWVALARLAIRDDAAPGTVAPVAGVTALLATLFAGTAPLTVLANLDAVAAGAAAGVGPLAVVGLIAPALLAGLAAARCARVLERPASDVDARDLPSAGLLVGQTAAWAGEGNARWPLLLAAAGAVAVVATLLAGESGVVWGGLLLASTVTVGLSRVEVVVGAGGLRAALGPFGWPVVRLTREQISHAEAIEVVPAQWGGWGYRGSLRLFGRAAIVLRGGPGLKVSTVDERILVVTVEDPQGAAGVLNDLVGASAPTGG